MQLTLAPCFASSQKKSPELEPGHRDPSRIARARCGAVEAKDGRGAEVPQADLAPDAEAERRDSGQYAGKARLLAGVADDPQVDKANHNAIQPAMVEAAGLNDLGERI